jgi:nitrile hydratase accessory protein
MTDAGDTSQFAANNAAAHARSATTAFDEPWQAQAFACAIHLSQRGLFTWAEWSEVFGATIKQDPARPRESHNDAYFRQWLAALEKIVEIKQATSQAEIEIRQEAWREAYLNTPHGAPVELANATRPPVEPSSHHPPTGNTPRPVTVSLAQSGFESNPAM